MPDTPRFRLPHPLILLTVCVAIAAALTWILPAGEFERREDPDTHRTVVVAGTYHAVPRAPVGPFAAVVAIPRGFIEAGDVIVLVLLVGGAWFVVDRLPMARILERLNDQASALVRMAPATLALIRDHGLAKGDVLGVARLAGIMAAKRTGDLIPLCHPLPITSATVDFSFLAEDTDVFGVLEASLV